MDRLDRVTIALIQLLLALRGNQSWGELAINRQTLYVVTESPFSHNASAFFPQGSGQRQDRVSLSLKLMAVVE